MSKFILVCYGTEGGMELLGKYDTEHEAFNNMIDNIESLYDMDFDMRECEFDSNGMCKHEADNRSYLYWGNTWANCYGNGYEDHYGIFEI